MEARDARLEDLADPLTLALARELRRRGASVDVDYRGLLPLVAQHNGKAVVIEVNTYQERWLRSISEDLVKRGRPPVTIRGFTTATEAMTALRAGQGDAAALLDYMAVDMTKRGMIRTVLHRLGGAPSAMAFRQRPVAEAVAAALESMRKDGSYGALFERYGLTPQPVDQPFAIRGPGPG